MSKLFQYSEINGMRLANRFVRSATWEGMATDDGEVTPLLNEMMRSLSKGKVGMIITSHAYILPEGQAGFRQIGIYKDEFIDGLREMVKSVHSYDSRIILQLSHAGYFSNVKFIGMPPLAPSSVKAFAKTPRTTMSIEDIQRIVEAFGMAANRAKAAGFDGVQIQTGHGYLLNQFLSPAFNRRKDEYGGSLENRTRILRQVLGRVRKSIGDHMPLLAKMNCRDFHENGIELEESLYISRFLQENGVDAIELSGGSQVSGRLGPIRTGIKSKDQEAYFREEAKIIKKGLDIPLILVGGIRSFDMAESLVENEYADYISMSRPFIREPDLIARWASGDLRKSKCVSDTGCFKTPGKGNGIFCVMKDK